MKSNSRPEVASGRRPACGSLRLSRVVSPLNFRASLSGDQVNPQRLLLAGLGTARCPPGISCIRPEGELMNTTGTPSRMLIWSGV
jgi:hypothetical protein